MSSHAGAQLILAKTTNAVCSKKFRGAFAKATADFASTNKLTKARTLNRCKAALLADYGVFHGDHDKTATTMAHGSSFKSMSNSGSENNDNNNNKDKDKGRVKEFSTPSVAANYCVHGVFDNTGSADLNRRLWEHIPVVKTVRAARTTGSVGGGEALVAVFNDNALQSCQYTGVEDGRHYHPLNTVRVRMLGNLIVQAASMVAIGAPPS